MKSIHFVLSEQQRGRPEWTKGSVHEHTVLFLASVSVPSVFRHLVRTAEGTRPRDGGLEGRSAGYVQPDLKINV